MTLREKYNEWRRVRIYKRMLKLLEKQIEYQGWLSSIGCPSDPRAEEAARSEYNRLYRQMMSRRGGRHARH